MLFLSIWGGVHDTSELRPVESMACMKYSPSETTSLGSPAGRQRRAEQKGGVGLGRADL